MYMFTMFDPMYWIIIGPTILLTIYAQIKVKTAFSHWSRVANSRGISGAEAAAEILRHEGIYDVTIESVGGRLSDHYDPGAKTLRLSNSVYHGRSIAAVGIAAHEVGHAIQHASSYAFLGLRSAMVPLASIGSNFSFFIILLGMIFHFMALVQIGIIAFSAVVAFQIITLPVEFNASSRAKAALTQYGIIRDIEEQEGVESVLSAAALTYVAAALAAVANLLYFIMLASGDRRR